MIKKNARLVLAVVCLLTVTGCQSTIGNKTSLNKVAFLLDKTDKHEVAETLGLPAAVLKENDSELWAYHDKPQLTGLYTGIPISDTTGLLMDFTFYKKNPGFKKATLICTFNKDGILTHIQHKTKEM